MRPAPLFAVAALAGALGAGLVVAVAASVDAFDDEPERVLVETVTTADEPESGPDGGRPLTGNGFDPAAIYAARSPGVVTVYADIPGSGRSQGSGFVVDDEGTILTSAHVITSAGASPNVRGAEAVVVEFADGDRARAEVVGWDLFADAGVLRVEPGAHELVALPLGDSADLSVGDPVAAIGSPFGNQGSLAVGVVSAIGRSVPTLTSGYTLTDAIQIDAPINRGNSGGPLFDARGRVVGINAQIRSDSGTAEGVGFAVPVDSLRRSLEQLLATGEVSYPYVGIRSSDVTPGLARRFDLGARRGALVESVSEGSPAERAGMRGGTRSETHLGLEIELGGDLVVAIGGEPVTGAADVARILTEDYGPGDRVAFTVVRDGRREVLDVVLGERPPQPRD
jgi:S1-C subfamily serine protease